MNIKELSRSTPPNYLYGAVWCLCIVVLWLSSLYGVLSFPDYWLLCAPFFGASMLGASIALHECAHGSMFNSKKINTWLGYFFGLCSLQPFQSYQRGHNQHHLWQGTLKDPTPTPLDQPQANWFLDILLWSQLPILYWGGVWWPYMAFRSKKQNRFNKLLEIGLMLLPHVVLALAVTKYLNILVLAFIIYSIGYERLFTLNQHMGLRPKVIKNKYTAEEQMQTSRTINMVASQLFLNFNFHKEHHRFPSVHWSQLPEIHKALKQSSPQSYTKHDCTLNPFRRRSGRLHEVLWPTTDK